MNETITLKCVSCGKTVSRSLYCPYTGLLHGRGWVYICECRGDMQLVYPEEVQGKCAEEDSGRMVIFPGKIGWIEDDGRRVSFGSTSNSLLS